MNRSTSRHVVQSEVARNVCTNTKALAILLSQHGTLHLHRGPDGILYGVITGFLTNEARHDLLFIAGQAEQLVADVCCADEGRTADDLPIERCWHVRLS